MSYTISSRFGLLNATITPATMHGTTTWDDQPIEFHIQRTNRPSGFGFVEGGLVNLRLTRLLNAGCTVSSIGVSGDHMYQGRQSRIVSLGITSRRGKSITFWGPVV